MQTTAEALCAELDRIHLALRDGRIDGLAANAVALEAQIASLGDAGIVALDRIRRKAARNAACLAAAGRGVRAARRRLAEIAAMAEGLGTYDPQGRRDAGPLRSQAFVQRL